MNNPSVVRLKTPRKKRPEPPGKVWIVGAGPGDPGLLTVKALQTIQQADAILFDQLVSQDIRDLFPASTPAIYVGKKKGAHSISQEGLNNLLVEKAQQGLNVCRLKGGDALVFGRGGEEMLQLTQAGIKVELVPGITAASGCSSYAGIPLTHRGLSQGCTFITAHAEKNLGINWQALASLNQTLVFYMGLTKARMIRRNLIGHGLNSSTPCAVIENGCRSNQRVFRAELRELEELILNNAIQSPSLIVVGNVVALADQLQFVRDELSTSHPEFSDPKAGDLHNVGVR